MKAVISVSVLVLLALGVNWAYQVARKPSELFFPVSEVLYKTPDETWRSYSSLFARYATRVMTPDLLAAIAQVEGSGNPVARTYWRWSWSWQLFEIYRPASSAVGMYQMTDGTFAEARRYCIHDHAVVADGPWYAWRSCWFNRFYARVVPGDAIELTAAYLDRSVAVVLDRHGRQATSQRLKQELAAVLHLCGAGVAGEYVARGFRLTEGQRCGDHEVRAYLARVEAMKATFARLSAGIRSRTEMPGKSASGLPVG